MTTYWISAYGLPSVLAEKARELEAEGWHGLSMGESPNQLPLAYLQLYGAALATTELLLGTGVTHPAPNSAVTTASAIATIQIESHGRAVLGIGRGDSGHACLGLAPAPLPVFESYVRRVHGYLAGQTVENWTGDGGGVIPPLSSLGLDQGSMLNKLKWLDSQTPVVPIDIAASGPRTIQLAARLADRITFAVGAEARRIKWAMEVARAERRRLGEPEDTLRFGAFVPFSAGPDSAVARERSRGPVASFARMSAMHPGQQVAGVAAEDEAVYEGIRSSYDFKGHFREGAAARQSQELPADFVDRFGVAGSAAECADRLLELAELGLDRIVLIPPSGLSQDEIYGRTREDESAVNERQKLIRILRG